MDSIGKLLFTPLLSVGFIRYIKGAFVLKKSVYMMCGAHKLLL